MADADRVKSLKALPRTPWIEQRRIEWTKDFLRTTEFPACCDLEPEMIQDWTGKVHCMLFGDRVLTDKIVRDAYTLDPQYPLPTFWDESRFANLNLLKQEDMEGPWEATSGGGCGGTASKLTSAEVYIMVYDHEKDFVDPTTRLFMPNLFDSEDQLVSFDQLCTMDGYESASKTHNSTTELIWTRSKVSVYPHCRGPAVYPSLELDFIVFLGFNSKSKNPLQEQRLRKRAKVLGDTLYGNELRIPFIYDSLVIFPYSRYHPPIFHLLIPR